MTESWRHFITQNGLAGRYAAIPESETLSGLSASIMWLNEKQSKSEATDCHPGVVVAADGFIPVGICGRGSGDLYCIRSQDGDDGPLFRIFQDSVRETEYSMNDAVVQVLAHSSDALRFTR
jgi:hypothetical protein